MVFHSGKYSEVEVCMAEEDQDMEIVEDMDEDSNMEEELTVALQKREQRTILTSVVLLELLSDLEFHLQLLAQ